MADRYISDKCLPDKAIDLIDEAAAELKIESNKKPQIILQQENKLHAIDEKLNNLRLIIRLDLDRKSTRLNSSH